MEKDLNYYTKQVRRCMLKLQKTGEINVIGANKSTTIKVCSFKSYQDKSEPKETTGASKRANQGETKGKPRGNQGETLYYILRKIRMTRTLLKIQKREIQVITKTVTTVRTATNENNEPLFCLADVCNILGLSAGDVKRRLEKDVVSTQPLMTAGGMQQVNFVNEDGLYDVILDSRKEEAKAFRK